MKKHFSLIDSQEFIKERITLVSHLSFSSFPSALVKTNGTNKTCSEGSVADDKKEYCGMLLKVHYRKNVLIFNFYVPIHEHFFYLMMLLPNIFNLY